MAGSIQRVHIAPAGRVAVRVSSSVEVAGRVLDHTRRGAEPIDAAYEAVQYRFATGRIQFVDGAQSCGAAAGSGSVEVTGRVADHTCRRAEPIGSAREAVEYRVMASSIQRFYLTSHYEMFTTGNFEAARKTLELWAQNYPRDG